MENTNKAFSNFKTVHLNIDPEATEEERKEIINWVKENFVKEDD